MVNNMAYVLIETIIKKTLKDMTRSPEHGIRNLVSTALEFSDGAFQRTFFEMAHSLLQNPHSAYYGLIKDAAAHVDHERLLRFGMNLGYNSCTAGVNMIRQTEARLGFSIPWAVFLTLDGKCFRDHLNIYDNVLSQGEELGTHTWILSCDSPLPEIIPLIQKHEKSAFILLCRPEIIDTELIESLSAVPHLMLVAGYQAGFEPLYRLLRQKKLLYSLYFTYDESTSDFILSEDVFRTFEQLHSMFTVLIAKPDCPEEIHQKISQMVIDVRKKQSYQTVAYDVLSDNRCIDRIISEDSCSAHFDSNGFLCDNKNVYDLNLFDDSLACIFKKAFPRTSGCH